MKPILNIENLTKIYGNVPSQTKALNGITFQVMPGEFLGIMGSSGSGKSTLLNCIATVIQPTGGSIQVEGDTLQSLKGKALAEYRGKKVGYLFQNFELLDNLTGRENILLPTSLHGVSEAESSQRLKQLADYLEITDVLDKFPSKMSGGQRQRVAAARALILHPQMILADEPTGALDSKNARSLMEKLSGLNRDEQATILMVTHTVNFNLFAIQIRLAIGNVERAETDLRAFCIKHMPCGILQGDVHRVQVGIGSAVPTVDVGELLIQLLLCGFGSSANLEIGALLAHDVSGIIRNSCFQNKVRSFHSLVGNIHSCIHRRIVAIKLVVHEDTGAALVLSGNVLVGQCNELNITVDSRELRVIDVNRDGNRINIGYIDGERDGILILHILGQIEDECRITTDMGAHFLTIDLHCGVLVGTVELDEQVLAVVLGNIKLLAVRDGFLIVLGNVRHRRVCVIP